MSANTLFLRLEGPLQAWGVQESKFFVRRTAAAPTKSGVFGLLCAALGVSRADAPREWLPRLEKLRMAVRIDAPGVRWWDFHTVGAGMKMQIAEGEGKVKEGPILTRREYLCDASFLVALLGEPALVTQLVDALKAPKWMIYLGRKSCPPTRPVAEHAPGKFDDLTSALTSHPWRPRLRSQSAPESIDCLLDWLPSPGEAESPADAETWYDVPLSFEPPAHRPRLVVRQRLSVGPQGEVAIAGEAAQRPVPPPERPRADYRNTEYRKLRAARLEMDRHLCVFCKSPATTVQHITYRHAGGNEKLEELRALCRLCHDAVTMIEYGHGMGMDRINPEDEAWRDAILQKRGEIVSFRSIETRRRKMAAEEVE